ncbi:MAG: cephalosporin hydroxylase family protein [Alphaproteobacteria bacterium]|nr:cephalosporin hydroxylase family protein [Alphaproteobacteria bacterium]
MKDDTLQQIDSSLDPLRLFAQQKTQSIKDLKDDELVQIGARDLIERMFERRYMYNFEALGRPVIQFPADMVAIQEIVWATKPDLIVETGIAHGGSLIQSAQMLALLDLTEAMSLGASLDPARSTRRVVAVDIEIRPHNRDLIDSHPLRPYIEMIEGSSLESRIVEQVATFARDAGSVMVLLDSHHTRAHVLNELRSYAPLVSVGGFCVVFDTVVEEMPVGFFPDRPWGPGNGPLSAVDDFLQEQDGIGVRFERNQEYNSKLVMSGCRGGYLKRLA